MSETGPLRFVPSRHGASLRLSYTSRCGYQWTCIRCWLFVGHVLRLPGHEIVKGLALNE